MKRATSKLLGAGCVCSLSLCCLACGGENDSPYADGYGPHGPLETTESNQQSQSGPDPVPASDAPPVPQWPGPEASGEEAVSETIIVGSEGFDGEMKRYFGAGELGTGDQDENQGAIFKLHGGAVLENVIIGAPAADGVHCIGSCTIRNVWWEDVGEDAATFSTTSDEAVFLIEDSGARKAADKVFQHNGRGTFHIKNVFVEQFGKVYRSCGNCDTQYARRVIIEDLTAVTWSNTASIVGVNENYGDVAEFRGRNEIFDLYYTPICQRYIGNDSGGSPERSGVGPDDEYCLFDDDSVSVFLH